MGRARDGRATPHAVTRLAIAPVAADPDVARRPVAGHPYTGWTRCDDDAACLHEHAAEVGRPVPSVTLHAVRPDAAVIAHYAELGLERCIVILPPRADALPMLREWAGLVPR